MQVVSCVCGYARVGRSAGWRPLGREGLLIVGKTGTKAQRSSLCRMTDFQSVGPGSIPGTALFPLQHTSHLSTVDRSLPLSKASKYTERYTVPYPLSTGTAPRQGCTFFTHIMAANRTRSLRPDQRPMLIYPIAGLSGSCSTQSLLPLPPKSRGQISVTQIVTPQRKVPTIVRKTHRGESLSRQQSLGRGGTRGIGHIGGRAGGDKSGAGVAAGRTNNSGKEDGCRTEVLKVGKGQFPSESIFTASAFKRSPGVRPDADLSMSRSKLALPQPTGHPSLPKHPPLVKKEPSDSFASQSTIDTPSPSVRPMFLFGNGESPRVVGLRNFGNNCYMNAVVQCLNATPGFQSGLVAGRREGTPTGKTNGQLAEAMLLLVSEMTHGKKSPLNVGDVKSIIGIASPQFLTYEQHDAHEFLRCLLDALHEDMNRVKGRRPPRKLSHTVDSGNKVEDLAAEWWADCVQRAASQVTDLFRGQLLSIVTCSVCGSSRYTFEEFLDLSLPIPLDHKGVTLQRCFDEFTATKDLEGVKCKVCRTERVCSATMTIHRYPKVLVVHLKRFAVCGETEVKVNTSVSYPVCSLDLSRHTTVHTGASPLYDLFAVCHHFGAADFGHYYAYSTHSDCRCVYSAQWFTFDDTRVTQLIRPSEASRTGYVLFYSLRPGE